MVAYDRRNHYQTLLICRCILRRGSRTDGNDRFLIQEYQTGPQLPDIHRRQGACQTPLPPPSNTPELPQRQHPPILQNRRQSNLRRSGNTGMARSQLPYEILNFVYNVLMIGEVWIIFCNFVSKNDTYEPQWY